MSDKPDPEFLQLRRHPTHPADSVCLRSFLACVPPRRAPGWAVLGEVFRKLSTVNESCSTVKFPAPYFFYPGKACVLSDWHMMEGGAYGASFAGGAFDFQSFLKLPQTILRLLSWVSHTEALASRTSQLSHQEFSWTHVCRYRPNKPCNSG